MNILASILFVVFALVLAARASAAPMPHAMKPGLAPVSGASLLPAPEATGIPSRCLINPGTGRLTCHKQPAPLRMR
jgi:hypothetical protein